jgi:hypothetical protein
VFPLEQPEETATNTTTSKEIRFFIAPIDPTTITFYGFFRSVGSIAAQLNRA